MISDRQTRTLLALIEVYRRDGRATVRAVADELDRSVSDFEHSPKLGTIVALVCAAVLVAVAWTTRPWR